LYIAHYFRRLDDPIVLECSPSFCCMSHYLYVSRSSQSSNSPKSFPPLILRPSSPSTPHKRRPRLVDPIPQQLHSIYPSIIAVHFCPRRISWQFWLLIPITSAVGPTNSCDKLLQLSILSENGKEEEGCSDYEDGDQDSDCDFGAGG
jgi:hypothetical protein